MNRYNIGFSLKLPIPGQQYSNLEQRFDWSEDTDLSFDKALDIAFERSRVAREKLDMASADLQVHYKTLIEEQEARLNKAREEYIKLASK